MKAAPEGATGDPAVIAVRADQPAVGVGEVVNVTLTLEPGAAPSGLVGVFLQFDAQRLRYVAGHVDRDVFTSELFTGAPQEVAPGLLAFSAGSDAGVAGGPVAFASLAFETIAAGDAALTLSGDYPAVTQVQDLAFINVPTQRIGDTIAIMDLNDTSSAVRDFMLY